MRQLRCALVGQLVTAAILTDRSLPELATGHQTSCLRCQAHSASIRATRRTLAGLSKTREVPPIEIEAAVLGTALVASTDAAAKPWLPAAVATAVVLAAAWAWRRREARA
jgi:MYXO-CTERM domain-containing protein